MNRFFILIIASMSFSIFCSTQILDPEFFAWCQETRDSIAQPFDALINLGGDCQVAYQMRLQGIRTEALPFDWIITPFNSLYSILENNFDDFMKQDNLVFIETEKEKYILDKKYGVRFLHDFKLIQDFLKEYEKFKEIYDRRINRFLKILRESKHALFIRKKIKKQQALQLRSLLHQLCPENDFVLLAVDSTDEIKQNWNLDHIKNFYLRAPEPASWKGDPLAWQEVFEALGLQLAFDDHWRAND